MSFGFSVGDFLATLKLADGLKMRFAQAPSEFKAMSGEVKSLWAVLHDLDYVPKEGLNVHQKGEMDAIVQKGREVLLEIDSKLSKHNVLAFSTSNWKTKALRAWSRVTWDPAEFSTLRDRITSCISLTNLVMGKINQNLTLGIQEEVHTMKENSESQQRDETLQWICPFDQAARQAKLLCIGRDGPGKWFLECEEFLLWISNENIKTLFCTGVPGASKTVLSSIAVDHLQEKFSNDDDVAVVYFYFDFQQPFDFTTLISSLLRQLLQASPGLHGTILGLNISRRYSRGPLPEDRVKEELRRVISQLSKVFFVVDALEECVDVRVRRQFFSG